MYVNFTWASNVQASVRQERRESGYTLRALRRREVRMREAARAGSLAAIVQWRGGTPGRFQAFCSPVIIFKPIKNAITQFFYNQQDFNLLVNLIVEIVMISECTRFG